MSNEILVANEKDNFYKIFIEEDKKMKCLKFVLKNIFLPFGLEEYNNKYIINFELNDNKEFENYIRKLEKNINNLIDEDSEIKSVFKKKENYNLLCKSYIKKNKNKFITIYKNLEDKDETLFNIKKNKNYDIELEISGIWKFNNLTGLYINIISIKNIN